MIQKIKDFLLTSMGTLGLVLYFAVAILVTILPLLMFKMPFWLYILLALLVQTILINIPFCMEVLYIIGLFGAINSKQDIFTIIYYIVFALIIVPTIIRLISLLFTRE